MTHVWRFPHRAADVKASPKKATQKQAARSANKNGRMVLLVAAAVGIYVLFRRF